MSSYPHTSSAPSLASARNVTDPVTYLDVAAVRIQPYLSRTRRLWGRRGASAVLADRASPRHNPELIAPLGSVGVEINTEAGEKDGVVSVIVRSTDDGVIGQVAERIARAVTKDLPGLHLTASWASEPTYLQALAAMHAAQRPRFEWLAPLLEFPAARLCQECGLDAATDEITVVGTTQQVCPDCFARRNGLDDRPDDEKQRSLTRHPVVVRRTADGVGTFTAEAMLLEHFDRKAPDGRRTRATKDFEDLARQSDDPRHNHVATIAADGNSLGRLFRAATHRLTAGQRAGDVRERSAGDSPDVPPDDLRELSQAVTRATREALIAASEEVFHPGTDPFLTVVPHVLGGDDVLVSVPADRAWPFVRVLLAAFGGGTPAARDVMVRAERLEIPAPSLSAGVVISHAALPFGQQVTLAERLLGQAKARVAGDGFSVAWLDTTADGAQPVSRRRPWTLAELNAKAAGLTALAGAPPSALQALAREIDTPDVELAQRRVASRLKRQEPEVRTAVHDYLGPRAEILLTRAWTAPELVETLRDGLSLARWWR